MLPLQGAWVRSLVGKGLHTVQGGKKKKKKETKILRKEKAFGKVITIYI